MKKLFRANILIMLFLLSTACSQSSTATPSPIPSPSATATVTLTPVPNQTSIAPIEPTPRPEYVPPTLIPTIDPTLVSGLLSKAFSVQTMEGLNSRTVQQITGWDYGFGAGFFYDSCADYYWLDTSHLLLYPRTGQEWDGFTGMSKDLAPQPTVINIKTGMVWLPYTSEIVWSGNCDAVYWSSELSILIAPGFNTSSQSDSQEAVFIYTFDGQKIADYHGKLKSVSPSRTKILVNDDSIIDLRSNKKMPLAWHINYDDDYAPRIYWSSDETRVYRCCYYFADTATGKTYGFEPSEFEGTGAKPSANAAHSYGQWVRNDDYFLIEWSIVDNGYPDFFPLFDPVARKYYEISEMAGIPSDWTCVETNISSDGIYVWLECWEGSYLIDLETFNSVAYPNFGIDDIKWSKDGKFAWVKVFNTNLWQILSVSDKELKSLSVGSIFDIPLWWHPTNNVLAYISEDKQKLELVNAQTMSVQEIALPTTFQELVWNSPGDHIALLAEDGSLWQLDYPQIENLEQLTQPMLNVRDVFWSPDGNSIAFIGGSDIYIVDTMK